MTVDLESREVSVAGLVAPFEVDDYIRWRLLEGLDDIGITLQSGRRDHRVRGATGDLPADHGLTCGSAGSRGRVT